MNSVLLFGFQYTGKTTIGQAIATRNNFQFIDIDKEIEKKFNKTIIEITQNGKNWKDFRKMELEILNSYLNTKNIVLSCGGGMFVNELHGKQAKDLIENDTNFLKILCDADKESILRRQKTSYKRPTINNTQTLQLLHQRKDLYQKINYDIKIDTSNDNIANAIVNEKLCSVIGDPVWHSMSPKIHNHGYEYFKIDNAFCYTKIEISNTKISCIKNIINLLGIKGLSVTSPHKETITKYLDFIDPLALKTEAVNTILNNNNFLYGYNTDCFGVEMALKNTCSIIDRKIAIFGSGGAAKAATIALLSYTKNITLFNRTKEKNDTFAKENKITNKALNEFQNDKYDIIINATNVGQKDHESILKAEHITSKHIVFDMVYNSAQDTQLIKLAKQKNAKIIYGQEMLLHQALKQFEIFTNFSLPSQIGKEILIQKNICTVIIGNTLSEFLENLKKAQKISNFLELRVDYIKNLSKQDIQRIANHLLVASIFTCRMKKYGGFFSNNINQNREIIEYAHSLNKFTYFDIDFGNTNHFQKLIQDKTFMFISSYHSFDRSLSYKRCCNIIDRMNKTPCRMKKIATTIQTETDVINMIKILHKYSDNNLIFAPMTENKLIRILALQLKSCVNFFSLDENSITASGQLSIQEYEKIKNLLF